MARLSLVKKWIVYYGLAFLVLGVAYALREGLPGAGLPIGVYLVLLVLLVLSAAAVRFWISRHRETTEGMASESKEDALRTIAERALRGRKN